MKAKKLIVAVGILVLGACSKKAEPEYTPWYEIGMRDKTYINNGQIQVGVDLQRGGCIFNIAESSRKTNLINHHDTGRYLQQSYFGDLDGSWYEILSWRYNPIQGGSFVSSTVGKVVSFKKEGNTMTIENIPVHWAKGTLMEECLMKEVITLDGNIIKLQFSIKYNGDHQHEVVRQEMPSFYPNFEYSKLVWYDGNKPWTGGVLKKIEVESMTTIEGLNKFIWPEGWTEKWAAYVDETGWGIGLYSPQSTYCTYYRYGDGSETGSSSLSTSYFAPVAELSLTPGKELSYVAYVTMGTPDEIRARFKKIHSGK